MRLKCLWRNGTFALLVLVVPGQPAVAGTAPVAGDTLADTSSAAWNVDQIPQAIQGMLLASGTALASPEPTPDNAYRRINSAQWVRDFYLSRRFAPLWTTDRDIAALAQGLASIKAEGLNPADYHLSQLITAWRSLNATTPPMERARFDVAATTAYVSALVDLRQGKVDPATLDLRWNFTPPVQEPGEDERRFLEVLQAHDIARGFREAPPQVPFYSRLRQAMLRLLEIRDSGGWPLITSTAPLRPGSADVAVIQLRQRLATAGYLNRPTDLPEFYDEPLLTAVKQYQSEQYLEPDGVVGDMTLAALNVPIQARIDQLRVNMERARWLFKELQGNFVIVDIAGYKIALYRDGRPIWRSRVQVGKPFRRTPVFQSNIDYVTFNPTWTVPPTILTEDLLPRILNNPRYLAEHRIDVIDKAGQRVDPMTVDWRHPAGITLRQQAGPDNALGQVAIRFANPYSVYLHDTPHRELFNGQRRATSSGCIRVENPLKLVELLFNEPQRWGTAGIAAQLATGKTTHINLPVKVPILLAYWTVDLRDDGRVTYKPDIYGYDQELLKALGR